MSNWLIIGSGPSVTQYAKAAFAAVEKPCTICACNSGLFVDYERGNPQPQKLVIITQDREFLSRNRRTIENHISAGAQFVTTIHIAMAEGIGGDNVEALIIDTLRDEWKPGAYSCAGKTGALALQYAIANGAQEIHIVGFDGYRSSEGACVIDTYDGAFGPETGADQTRDEYGPMIQRIMHRTPEVEYVFYGEPTYKLQGVNLEFRL